jgi:hypothetical protein
MTGGPHLSSPTWRIPAGLDLEADPSPHAPASLPWPARLGGLPGLYKPRRTPWASPPVP